MRHAILWLAPLSLAAACSNGDAAPREPAAKASGQQGTRTFAVTDFDSISLAGPDDVRITVGPAFSIKASGDTGLIEALDVKRDGRTLEIGRKREKSDWSWNEDDDNHVQIAVTLPALKAAVLAGSGTMRVTQVRGDEFKGTVAGSGDMELDSVGSRRTELVIAGSGDLRATGTAEQVKLSIAGSGDVDASRLSVRNADVSIAGSGNVRMAVDGPAKVSIVGSGNVDLGPKARCTTSKLGSGDVVCGG